MLYLSSGEIFRKIMIENWDYSHYSHSIYTYVDNPNDWIINDENFTPKNLTKQSKNDEQQSSRNHPKSARKTGKNHDHRIDRLARNCTKITQ